MRRRIVPLLAVALVAVLAFVALSGRSNDEGDIQVEFADAAGLRPESPVRVGGARVGTVSDLHITDRDTALVRLRLDDDLQLGADARARVRPANLLGEKFVELEVGDRARPLRSGRIALARTSTPVELDDVLDVLDPTTRGRLGVLIGSAGIALDGRGTELKAALEVLPGTIDDATTLAKQLDQDRGALRRLLSATDRVTGTLDGQRERLGDLVASADRALAAPAREQAGLQRLLERTGPALRQLRTSLARVDRTGRALRPAATGLRATAAPLDDTLRALPGFQTAATPALRQLRATAPSLRLLGRESAPVLREVRPALDQVAALTQEGDPFVASLRAASPELLGFTENWARATQGRDRTGHTFRVSLNPQLEVIRSLLGVPTTPASRSRPKPSSPGARRPATPKPASGGSSAAVTAPNAASSTRPAAPLPPAPSTSTVPDVVGTVTDALGSILDRLIRP